MAKDWNAILQESNQNYTVLVDEVDSSTTYVGEAVINLGDKALPSEAKWRIRKITVSGTITTISWANNTDGFTEIWDDRASATY